MTVSKELEAVVEAALFVASEPLPRHKLLEVFDKRDRHPDWFNKAEPVIKRVSEVWATVGLAFPLEEIMEGW